MCGEHSDALGQVGILQGSSPHVRGAHGTKTLGLLFGGIIPACAGSTILGTGIRFEVGDHPRMCGEHIDRIIVIPQDRGSSPHVRGAQVGEVAHGVHRGIIPACAGSTWWRSP